jgi:hypothetical protein
MEYKRVVRIAPYSQGGRDLIAGFNRIYKAR